MVPAIKDLDLMLPDGKESYCRNKRNLKLGFEWLVDLRMFG